MRKRGEEWTHGVRRMEPRGGQNQKGSVHKLQMVGGALRAEIPRDDRSVLDIPGYNLDENAQMPTIVERLRHVFRISKRYVTRIGRETEYVRT